MTEFLEKLCRAFAPSGEEDEVRELIINEIKDYADYKIDKCGNLFVFKKGKSKRDKLLLVTAHMDEVGFMLKWFSEDGYIYFDTIGGIDKTVIAGRRLVIGDKRMLGVVASKAIHMQKPEERGMCVPIEEMYLDIGCATEEQAKALAAVGDLAVFEPNFEYFGDGMIKSKALDDRIGCALLCEIIKGEIEYDTVFAFNVCEEVGVRGSVTAAFGLNPDITIVLEATTAGDIGGADKSQYACRVGEGVVLSHMDAGTIYDRELLNTAISEAKEKEIKYQIKNIVAGGNDSQSYQKSACGSRVLALSAPTRYIHSACSVAKIDDINEMLKLAKALIGRSY